MKKDISQDRFHSLAGFELGRELIAAPIQQARGRNLAIKKEVYDGLTPGQRSLFGFWVLYGHVQDGWLPFLQWAYGEYLRMIRASLQSPEFQSLMESLDRADHLFQDYQRALDSASPEAAGQIAAQFAILDSLLPTLLPAAMSSLEALIRVNPQEFVSFTD